MLGGGGVGSSARSSLLWETACARPAHLRSPMNDLRVACQPQRGEYQECRSGSAVSSRSVKL